MGSTPGHGPDRRCHEASFEASVWNIDTKDRLQVEMDEEERAMVAEGAASQQNGTAAADKAPAAQPGKAAEGPRPADEDDDDDMRIVRDYKRSDAR